MAGFLGRLSKTSSGEAVEVAHGAGRGVVEEAAVEVRVIPSNVPHQAEALEATLDVDVFCPPRQDWLDGTDDCFHRK